MRVLVTAASRHGATAEMAAILGQALAEAGIEAAVKPLAGLEGVAGFNAVVLGSGVYMGHWMPEAVAFVRRHAIELRARPVWLFSSGPIGSPDPKPEGDPAEIAELSGLIQARGHRIFTGRIDKRLLAIGERLVVGAVHAPEGDFRDPEAIRAWTREIATQLSPMAVAG